MSWYSGLESFVRLDEPLAERTTFAHRRAGGVLLEPATEAEFAAGYAAAVRSGCRCSSSAAGATCSSPTRACRAS